jgi:hypothetical protein
MSFDYSSKQEVINMPPDGAVTKYVALTLHWPHLVAKFSQISPIMSRYGVNEYVSLLATLETKAQDLSGGSTGETVEAWKDELQNAGFAAFCDGTMDDLRRLLSEGSFGAKYQGCGLW